MVPFGFSQEAWDSAKSEIKATLIERAKKGKDISYSELTLKVTSIQLEPHGGCIAELLGEISTQEAHAGRGMLSVIVVHKEGDKRPGPGFFKLARQLERDTSDRDRLWVEEFTRVCAYWRDHS